LKPSVPCPPKPRPPPQPESTAADISTVANQHLFAARQEFITGNDIVTNDIVTVAYSIHGRFNRPMMRDKTRAVTGLHRPARTLHINSW
jgi:hypothetical protein